MPTENSERRIIYLERKEGGYCPRCGNKKNRADKKFSYCGDCRLFFRKYQKENSEIINEMRRDRYYERKNNGQCPRCGVKLEKNSMNALCENCLDKQYEYNTNKR